MDGQRLTSSPESYPEAALFLEPTRQPLDENLDTGARDDTLNPGTQATERYQPPFVEPKQLALPPGHEAPASLMERVDDYFERYDQAIARGEEPPRKIGILWIDLEDFKELQDAHPRQHAAGDDILKLVTKVISRTIRLYDESADPQSDNSESADPGNDDSEKKSREERRRVPTAPLDQMVRVESPRRQTVVARKHGDFGDEFVVLAEVDTEEGLTKIAERIREALANLRVEGLIPNGIKISIGGKVHDDETSAIKLLAAADFLAHANKMDNAYADYESFPPRKKRDFWLARHYLGRVGISGRRSDKLNAAIQAHNSAPSDTPRRKTTRRKVD